MFDQRFCSKSGTRALDPSSGDIPCTPSTVTGTECTIRLTRNSWPVGPAVVVKNQVSFDGGSNWNDWGAMTCEGGSITDKFGNATSESLLWTSVPDGAVRRTVITPLANVETTIIEAVS